MQGGREQSRGGICYKDVKNLHQLVRKMTERLHADTVRFNFRFRRPVQFLLGVIRLLSFMAALTVVTSLILYIGFEHTVAERVEIDRIVRIAGWVCVGCVVVRHLLDRQAILHSDRPLKRIVDVAVLLMLLPLVSSGHPVLACFAARRYVWTVLTVYSVLEISREIMALLGRRVNPSLMMTFSFLILIFLGTWLLMLPRCTYGGIGFVDSLFVSTSAVCITGLTPVDVSATFTPVGLVVLAVLIQVGGLGLLTFTSVFALSFTGNTSLYSQLMIKDMVYSRSWSELPATLLYILIFTLAIEAVGSVAVFACIHDKFGMTIEDEIFTACFTSLSGFCNAGFSNLPGGMAAPQLLFGGQAIYWVMSVLIVAGSIGFPLLVNIKDMAVARLSRHLRRLKGDGESPRPVHLVDMNSKIVIVSFTTLFLLGAVGFGVFEWNNTLSGMDVADKVAQSVFNSTVPRSAGFSSVPVSGMRSVTVVMLLLLMWIGGASQSTGGGIKVNTFSAVFLNLRAIIRGGEPAHAFGRRITIGSLRRANAVVALSVIGYTFFSMALLLLEPELPVRDLLFESASALFTVGSSMGVTPRLGDSSLILLCGAMLLGRVGILSLLSGMVRNRSERGMQFPTENMIIN